MQIYRTPTNVKSFGNLISGSSPLPKESAGSPALSIALEVRSSETGRTVVFTRKSRTARRIRARSSEEAAEDLTASVRSDVFDVSTKTSFEHSVRIR